MTQAVEPVAANVLENRVPPIAPLATSSLALIVVGGVVIAASFPALESLAAPIALLVLSAALLAVAAALLSRQQRFAWPTFFRVGRWALLAYAISAGMIEFAFVRNHMSGTPLLIVTCMLVMFAVDVAFIVAFTAARFQDA